MCDAEVVDTDRYRSCTLYVYTTQVDTKCFPIVSIAHSRLTKLLFPGLPSVCGNM